MRLPMRAASRALSCTAEVRAVSSDGLMELAATAEVETPPAMAEVKEVSSGSLMELAATAVTWTRVRYASAGCATGVSNPARVAWPPRSAGGATVTTHAEMRKGKARFWQQSAEVKVVSSGSLMEPAATTPRLMQQDLARCTGPRVMVVVSRTSTGAASADCHSAGDVWRAVCDACVMMQRGSQDL